MAKPSDTLKKLHPERWYVPVNHAEAEYLSHAWEQGKIVRRPVPGKAFPEYRLAVEGRDS